MALLFEDIDVKSVSIPNLYSILSFSSESDTLFSAIISKHTKLQWDLIDDLLSLFRNVAFRPTEVTFKSAEDIADRIAEQRRRLAVSRKFKRSRPTLRTTNVIYEIPNSWWSL